MKIYYKKRDIDYERTLRELEPGEQFLVSTYDKDLANVRENDGKYFMDLNCWAWDIQGQQVNSPAPPPTGEPF